MGTQRGCPIRTPLFSMEETKITPENHSTTETNGVWMGIPSLDPHNIAPRCPMSFRGESPAATLKIWGFYLKPPPPHLSEKMKTLLFTLFSMAP